MAEVKAIELKGIVHNATKVGVQDGQAEDIVNLRFKDGAWRSAGDGKLLNLDVSGYTNIYIHTNVYRHMLGVKGGKLWWFATASESDPNAFTAITPVELCGVAGDVTITQNGHLITIIDAEDNFDMFVFKYNDEGVGFYKAVKLDENGAQNKRSIYPFGRFNISLVESKRYEAKAETDIGGRELWNGYNDPNYSKLRDAVNVELARDLCKVVRGKVREDNKFNQPFLAAVAVELYDGTIAFASNPILISPVNFVNYERSYNGKKFCDSYNSYTYVQSPTNVGPVYDKTKISKLSFTDNDKSTNFEGFQTLTNGGFSYRTAHSIGAGTDIEVVSVPYSATAVGFDVKLTIEDISIIKDNPDIFTAICLFVSPEVETLKFDEMENTKTDDEWDDAFSVNVYGQEISGSSGCVFNISTYIPRKSKQAIVSELMATPLFLLKRYNTNSIGCFENYKSVLVDINKDLYPGLVSNIASQSVRLSDSIGTRMTYRPRYAYSYNGRLHIANYDSTQWHGFPIDYYLNYKKDFAYEPSVEYAADFAAFMRAKKKPLAYVKAEVETNTAAGKQIVVRYADPESSDKWYRNIGTCLYNPLVGFNDYRASKITLYFTMVKNSKIYVYKNIFDLSNESSNGVNLAFYMNPELTPITPNLVGSYTLDELNADPSVLDGIPAESNVVEHYQNAIKVSKTDNPMFFPVANTYQVGSSEIVAMCSNAVAVGTGQTGDAPLYVFCKDGIYALFVDSSGQLTYTNARAIARDVCNNAKSVTPIDDGVVFTTDRGLMMIAGSEVVEIGQPLEGDYCKFAVVGNVDYNLICKNAYTLPMLADLSNNSITKTDFLDYLKHAIVAYNHNERELMICNILKKTTGRLYYDYMYVLDRNGNWTRRDYNAEQFVENYPVTFRVANGMVYQMDEQSDTDNGIFALSNVVKLDSIGFKAVDRVVARGVFDTRVSSSPLNVRFNDSVEDTFFNQIGEIYERIWSYKIKGYSSISITTSSGIRVTWGEGNNPPTLHFRVYNKAFEIVYEKQLTMSYDDETTGHFSDEIIKPNLNAGEYTCALEFEGESEIEDTYAYQGTLSFNAYSQASSNMHIGIYAFGSYDGRTWACLGHTERKGNFTDLGCNVERTDCKFFRFLVAGQIKKESRLDYFEISERASRLSTKIR